MKLPATWYRLFEARASDRMEPIRKEYDKRKSSTGLNYHQRLTVDANATVDFTLKLFEIETETLIETYGEWGKGYPDDQDYDDFMERLDSIAQTHISHFNHSHTNVFSQQNEFILKAQLEFVEREVKSNVGRAIKSLHTFVLEGKAKAEDDKNAPTGKSSSESLIYMRFNTTSAEKVWLEAIYDKLRKDEQVNPTQMYVQLLGKIPKDFKYQDIDPRLILYGVDITLLGILQIHPDTDLVSKTDSVIRAIRQAIIENPAIDNVNSEDIAHSTGLSKYEVSIIFGLLQHLGNFWSGGFSDTTGYRQIGIASGETVREYLNYENIDHLLTRLYQSIEPNTKEDNSVRIAVGFPVAGQRFSDRDLMLRAIELARKCISEPGKVSPKVGAVIARDGVILGEAFRGEINPGEHAEFTLFEKKLPDETLAGATLFTTLEPCTSRNDPKIPCAKRVIERRIRKVIIGALDRNPKIKGNGETLMLDAGVEIARFDSDLIPVLEELNRDFLRQYQKGRRKRTKAETKDPIASDTIGPNGFKIGYTENGDKVEWVIEDGETWPLILRRNDNDILAMYNELWDKVWYIRQVIRLEKMGLEEVSREDPAWKKMKEVEDKYGKENLGWDDVEWGIIQGKMAALAWVMGSEWDGAFDT
jgi:pyrimidine deaminase RibD-like protein